MSIEVAIRNQLLADATITAYVVARIGPVGAFENERNPYITYDRESGLRVQIMGAKSGIAHPVFRIESWAADYGIAHELADRVRIALDANVNTEWSGIRILATIIDDDEDLGPVNATEVSTKYGVGLDVEIWHDEATS